ncbi:MAG: C40 family peptidase, partial [Muribaculaceae bacterium]|nr:C40 family peptidase [Muribaculaceae bacterium]
MPLTLLGTTSVGLVNVSVACMRDEPRHGSELISQAIMGTPMRLIAPTDDGEWWRVQSPDGYEGYMIGNSLVMCDSMRYTAWKSAPRVVVTAFAQAFVTDETGHEVVSDVVNGCILEGEVNAADSICRVNLPDGRIGCMSVNDVVPIDQWACQPYDSDLILRMGRSMMGTPYLWGGMSTKSLDCSGFVRVCFWANGRLLPRDASPQAQSGNAVSVVQLQPGDLLFFGNADTGRINHVAISKGGTDFIHCSGRVMNGSLDPASPDYI